MVQESLRFCGEKNPTQRRRAPLQSVVAGYPLQMVAVNIVRPFPQEGGGGDSGNAYVLVTSDYFTSWVEAYAIPNPEAVRQVGRGILYYHSSSTLTMGINLNPMSFKTFASCCTLTYATPYHPNQMDWSSHSIAHSSPCLQRVYEHLWS